VPPPWPRSATPEKIADLLGRQRKEFEDAETRYLIAGTGGFS